MSSLSVVGKAALRIDGLEKVHGTLQFPSDIYTKDTLCCQCVFAPFPHAKINNIDINEALSVPGVVRIITAKDIPGPNRCTYNMDRPILCDEKSRYEGDVVAVVAAKDEWSAREGVKKVKIDFSALPLLTDPRQALDPDSPKVHESGNIMHEIHFKSGDPEAIFQRDDVVVIEQAFNLPPTDHAFLETEGGIAYPENGGIRMITGGQDAYYHQSQVANALALPLEKVRVIEPHTGGAFGGKADVSIQILIGLAAYLTDQPCRMVWSRHEHFISGVKRHPALIKLRGAASRDGKLLALDANVISDTGAYGVKGDIVLDTLVECLTGPYSIPNVKIDARLVYTNNFVCGAFRGFGANKGCFAIESCVSALAHQLGVDEVEFRRRNLAKQGELSGIGHPLLAPIHTEHTLDAISNSSFWKNRHKLINDDPSIRRGVGMALGIKGYGYGSGNLPDFGTAKLTLGMDGRLILSVGVVESGQGSMTTLAQMVAETLNCPLEMIDVIFSDTREESNTGTTAASRSTYTVGRAIIEAANELGEKIREVAGQRFHLQPSTIELKGCAAFNPANGESIPYIDIVKFAEESLSVTSVKRVAYSEAAMIGAAIPHPHVLYSSNAQVAQVAVDIETGEVRVERIAAFPEVGKVIFREGLEGQFEGGIAQGMGYALLERIIVENGHIQNADLVTYPIPTSLDMPKIEVVPIEIPEPSGPFGAKGIGENPQLSTAPAIIDAIENAIGVRFTTLPVTPERVLEALEAAKISAEHPEGTIVKEVPAKKYS